MGKIRRYWGEGNSRKPVFGFRLLGKRNFAKVSICLLSPKTTCPVGVTKTWSKPLLLPYLPPGMTRQPISFAQALTTCSVSFPSLSKPCLILSTVFCCDLGASNEIPFPIGLLPIRPRLVGVFAFAVGGFGVDIDAGFGCGGNAKGGYFAKVSG